MAPLAIALLTQALPALLNKLPEIASVFKNPDVRERNVEAVAKVGQIIVEATGSTNEQEAIAKIEADPEMAKAANEAIRANRAELSDLVDKVNAMDQANIKAAREYNATEPYMVDTSWIKMKFIHVLSLVFVGFSGVFVSLNWASLTAELKGAVITLMVIAGWTGVKDFWMGSSDGSQRKTESLLRK